MQQALPQLLQLNLYNIYLLLLELIFIFCKLARASTSKLQQAIQKDN